MQIPPSREELLLGFKGPWVWLHPHLCLLCELSASLNTPILGRDRIRGRALEKKPYTTLRNSRTSFVHSVAVCDHLNPLRKIIIVFWTLAWSPLPLELAPLQTRAI